MRIGLFVGLTGPITFAEALAAASQAERADLNSFWLPNIFSLDALTSLAAIGGQTERIELGTNVVPIYSRHPMALAQQALTTSVLTGGRLTLGIGLSHKFVVERMFGLSFDAPTRYMGEYLSILQPMLAGEAVHFEGAVLRTNGQLTVTDAHPVPVLLAAMGPRMLQLAARLLTERCSAGPARRTCASTRPRPSAPRRRRQGAQRHA